MRRETNICSDFFGKFGMGDHFYFDAGCTCRSPDLIDCVSYVSRSRSAESSRVSARAAEHAAVTTAVSNYGCALEAALGDCFVFAESVGPQGSTGHRHDGGFKSCAEAGLGMLATAARRRAKETTNFIDA